ncbi:heterokaryon incompatibility protein-domain-containing protein [Immersiella caudata]|uniref:Heterokaryon incompatibility protein-domain-containing protein n=1 Tax=Immersiella caudata TaxID=314043 RepID=A0AA40C3X2_9PEZI|nr:heterokaryon incompatibility protein-domain-containing protein [Immersiella caudata]
MRLLHAKSFELKTFIGNDTPPYAILSHAWGEEEVLFEDVCQGLKEATIQKLGWTKVQYTCIQAVADGYEYAWIDTCCIDKSSSAELSEAINSMFKWYVEAEVCYAYLEDVVADVEVEEFRNLGSSSSLRTQISESRWFTRGWTLQELIAPRDVRFYTISWQYVASRNKNASFTSLIEEVTGVPASVLDRPPCCRNPNVQQMWRGRSCTNCSRDTSSPVLAALNQHSISERMSWAAVRQTTRPEDQAYCLFGLFGVNMPLLYGEGDRAFRRLQEEIIRISNDQSILAFTNLEADLEENLLALSPYSFRSTNATLVPPALQGQDGLFSMAFTSKYIEIRMMICPCEVKRDYESYVGRNGRYLGILSCGTGSDLLARPAILLQSLDSATKTFYRVKNHVLLTVTPQSLEIAQHINPQTGDIEIQCQLDQCHAENVRLLLSGPRNSTFEIDDSHGLVEGTIPLRIFLGSEVSWVHAHPIDGILQHGSVPIRIQNSPLGTSPQNHVQSDPRTWHYFRYLPSVKHTRSDQHPNYDKDMLGRRGIICVYVERLDRPLWIVWGAFGMQEPPRPWCKILDSRELGYNHTRYQMHAVDYIKSWASEHMPTKFDSMLSGSPLHMSGNWPSEWERDLFGALLHSHHDLEVDKHKLSVEGLDLKIYPTAPTMVANIEWIDFLGRPMLEMEINIVSRSGS